MSLHIRLNCCLVAKSITASFLREQQLSLYILYIFICLTLTSLPFYLYRTVEVLADALVASNQSTVINSSVLAQIILLGVSLKPVLYCILLLPSKILFKCKCFTAIHVDRADILESDNRKKGRGESVESTPYVLRIPLFYPKIHRKIRTRSCPMSPIRTHRALVIHQDARWSRSAVFV